MPLAVAGDTDQCLWREEWFIETYQKTQNVPKYSEMLSNSQSIFSRTTSGVSVKKSKNEKFILIPKRSDLR